MKKNSITLDAFMAVSAMISFSIIVGLTLKLLSTIINGLAIERDYYLAALGIYCCITSYDILRRSREELRAGNKNAKPK